MTNWVTTPLSSCVMLLGLKKETKREEIASQGVTSGNFVLMHFLPISGWWSCLLSNRAGPRHIEMHRYLRGSASTQAL